jgi:hypothetical protein
VTGLFQEPAGATPLDADETAGLIPSWIATRARPQRSRAGKYPGRGGMGTTKAPQRPGRSLRPKSAPPDVQGCLVVGRYVSATRQEHRHRLGPDSGGCTANARSSPILDRPKDVFTRRGGSSISPLDDANSSVPQWQRTARAPDCRPVAGANWRAALLLGRQQSERRGQCSRTLHRSATRRRQAPDERPAVVRTFLEQNPI